MKKLIHCEAVILDEINVFLGRNNFGEKFISLKVLIEIHFSNFK